MIDRSLNYGRRHIDNYLSLISDYRLVLDIGAGQGNDLMLARKANPAATLHAIEVH